MPNDRFEEWLQGPYTPAKEGAGAGAQESKKGGCTGPTGPLYAPSVEGPKQEKEDAPPLKPGDIIIAVQNDPLTYSEGYKDGYGIGFEDGSKDQEGSSTKEEIRVARGERYGSIENNMTSCALILQGILTNHWQKECPPIHPRIVPLISALWKISRSAFQGKHEPDTHLDAHIYIDISDDLDERITT